MQDFKQRVVKGGMAKVVVQAANLGIRFGSLMILARLLDPRDFGLIGMVTALTGVLNLFRDFGLSSAAVQRVNVTHEQSSTLFWINLSVGAFLSCSLLSLVSAVVSFYHEPRLFGVTALLAMGFVINAAGIQHSALLQRQMRFTTLAMIDVVAAFFSAVVGISMAFLGYQYWSLVGMTLTLPFVTTIGLWTATRWIPGKPRRHVGLRPLMRFGGTVTVNSLLVYVAYNLEKVLLGRFWGAEVIGLYSRSYQLISIPTDSLNSAAGEVIFPALSRVRHDPDVFRSYFLKGYSLVLALTIPIAIGSALFASDLVRVALGPKWVDAPPIFRLLTPTILVFAMINPLGWMLFALGRVGQSLKVACVLSPLVISAYVFGLPYGPRGVAFAFSAILILWVVPHIAWCIKGTPVSGRDILVTVSRPFLSGGVAATIALGVQLSYGQWLSPLLRLIGGSGLLVGVYLFMLLSVMGQKDFYLDLVRSLRSSSKEKAFASA
jgi:PST family polysaccharide transporter